MNDLITILRVLRRHVGKLVTFFILIALVAVVAREGPLEYVAVSPDDSYRIEHYTPSLYQSWASGIYDPTIMRLYRNTDNEFMGESGVVDLSSGPKTLWSMERSGEVIVGTIHVFENVPPVSPEGIIFDYHK